MLQYDTGGATDVLVSNSTNVTAAQPTAAPTDVAEAEADDGVCIMSGLFAFLVSVPILLLEVTTPHTQTLIASTSHAVHIRHA